MSTEANNVQAAPNALQDFTKCPHWGTGGQFLYDPVTNTRTRVEAAPAAAAAETTAAKATDTNAGAPATTTVKKGAARG